MSVVDELLRTQKRMPRWDKKVVLIADSGEFTVEEVDTVLCWFYGKNMPNIYKWSRWWLATCCKLRLRSLKLYLVDMEQARKYLDPWPVTYHHFPVLTKGLIHGTPA